LADSTTQRAAFKFLREHLQSQEPFTLQELVDVTGWDKPGTMNTYLRKHFKGIIEKVGTSHLRVTDAFWKLATWRKFKAHVTQVRRVVASYDPKTSKVLIYDFLMPLTNEEHLRMTLDSLFYKDRMLARLKTIGVATLSAKFAKVSGQSDDDYLGSVVDFIKDRLVGYSISHVSGRFRSGPLLSQQQASAQEKKGRRYLIDETTAVTKFIFPYSTDEQLAAIKYLFQSLFIRSIIQLVNGEEQIWMVESGSAGSRLHMWERLGADEDEDDEGPDDDPDEEDEGGEA